MSKNRNKEKVAFSPAQAQRMLEVQKRDLIDKQFTINNLEHRLFEKNEEIAHIREEFLSRQTLDQQKINSLRERSEEDQKRMLNHVNKITELEINASKADSMIKALTVDIMLEKQKRAKEVTQLKMEFERERINLKFKIEDLEIYAVNRQANEQELQQLRKSVQFEKSERLRECADKERERIQETDKMKQDMKKRIAEMKTNLLSLRKEQLSTTTRIAILQNHQLTHQLEQQGKQAQNLISKEEEMIDTIKRLTRELQIHKEVEEELAKRTNFSKKIIIQLNEKIKKLQQSDQLRQSQLTDLSIRQEDLKNYSELGVPKESEMAIILSQIEKQLSETEMKYMQCQSKLLNSEKQREVLSNYVNRIENSSNEILKLLISFHEDVMRKSFDFEKFDQNSILKIDVDKLRTSKVEDWSAQQKQFVVNVLLHIVKPYINKKSILIPQIRKLLVVEDSIDSRVGSKSHSKLPRLKYGDQNKPKLSDFPPSIASKILGSNLRQWGKTVKIPESNSQRKLHKILQSQR